MCGLPILRTARPTQFLVAEASTLELSGIVGGARGLYKTGAGALILSGANTYTGAMWVAEGVLDVRHDLALGSTARRHASLRRRHAGACRTA